jgi:hypothetical protein
MLKWRFTALILKRNDRGSQQNHQPVSDCSMHGAVAKNSETNDRRI